MFDSLILGLLILQSTSAPLTSSDDVVVTVNPPAVVFSCPQDPNPQVLTGSENIDITATDDIAVLGVQVKIDDTNFGPERTIGIFTLPWDTTAISNGCHTVSAVARDNDGNLGTAVKIVYINN